MELLVKSFEESADGKATISDLFVDGARECFVLEDKVREIPGWPVAEWKIPKVTAIPSGRFRLVPVWSPKHACYVPLVTNVPGYTAVEIHWGNRDTDTEGCLLTGRTHPEHKDFIGESNLAWDALMPKLEHAWGLRRMAEDVRHKPTAYERATDGEDVWLTIDRSGLLPSAAVDPALTAE